MIEQKRNSKPLAWITAELRPQDIIEVFAFGDDDQLVELFAAAFEKFPYLLDVAERARVKYQNKNN